MRLIVVVAVAIVFVEGCKVNSNMPQNEGGVTTPAPANVVDTIAAAGQYGRFLAALQKSGLDDRLRGPGPFTVFVPNKEAWSKLPQDVVASLFTDGHEEQLRRVAANHIVPGRLNAVDLAQRNWVVNVNGTTLPIRRAGLMNSWTGRG